MASWKKVIVSGSNISTLNNDANYLSSTSGILSASLQIAADISGSGNVRFESLNTHTGSILATQVIAGTGLTGGGTLAANRTFNVASANNGIVANADNIELAVASSTFTGGVDARINAKAVTSGSAAQIRTQINVEDGATADQSDAEIRTAVEAATDSNVFTDADHSKLNAIEASADVTDTANVTSAGALMDSELSEIATVKALTAAGISGSLSNGAIAALAGGYVSASAFSSPSQGTVRATINGANTDIDTGLQTGDSPTFTNLTLSGNLTVNGTRTIVDSTTLDIGDNIIALNGSGAALGGLHINDANGPASGSLLWDGTNNKWIGGASGSEVDVAFLKGQGLLSSSAQIGVGDGALTQNNFTNALKSKLDGIEASADVTDTANVTSAGALMDSEVTSLALVKALTAASISGSFISASNSLQSQIDSTSTSFTLAADSGTNDTFNSSETLTFSGGNGIDTVVSNNNIAINGVGGLVSGSAQVVALVEAGTDSNTFTDADHSKLNAIEASATADQTDAEIRAAVEAATDSNVFTDADHSKLNAIEASADVTDTANVTSAGALMDSELTNLAAVKAINQSLVTGASPTFASLTLSGDLTVNGTTTNVNTTDLNIEDKFILLNSGSATGNSGIIAQNSATNGLGTSLFFDDTANRWSLDYTGANANTNAVTADARIAAVALANDDANYQKDGNIFVDGSGDVFIYVE